MTDDLDGGPADRTVSFALDGSSYEIDLSSSNAEALGKLLQPYLDAARTTKGQQSPRPAARRSSTDRKDLHAVRRWANENGHTVSERGRIPAAILKAYEAAQ